MKPNVGLILGAAALMVALLAVSVLVNGRDDATNLEMALIQFFLFAVGFAATFCAGRRSNSAHAKDAAAAAAAHAKEVLEGHGVKALRRLVTQGNMIGDFRFRVAQMKSLASSRHDPATDMVPKSVLDQTISIMEMHIVGQTYAVTDATLDWLDVVPDAVEALGGKVEEDADV